MPLHRLSSVTIGVPNVAQTSAYYRDFGLTALGRGRFATQDGGEQLRLVDSPQRRLVEVSIGADDRDDLDRIADQLERVGLAARREDDAVVAEEPVTGIRAVVRIAERIAQQAVPSTPYNGPGRLERAGTRAPGVLGEPPVRPRNLRHLVVGSR